jgi:hypothetical protein
MSNKMINIEEEDNRIMSTKRINEITRKENMGLKIKKTESIWFSGMQGVRKPNLTFAMTDEELEEYIKCKTSVHYFAENYCKIKREDGSIGEIKLRDYQEKMINLFDENRFSLLMASRQLGKCNALKSGVYVILDGKYLEKTLGYLYYYFLKQTRKLTFLEKIKFKIYSLI